MMRIAALLTCFAAVFSGCEKNVESAVSHEPEEYSEPVLALPGTLQIPSSEGFTPFPTGEYRAVLLYCWLPMGEYEESHADLVFLASLQDGNVTAVPVQFSHDVRNAAQAQLNSLGIPLAVALGDNALKSFMGLDILPVAVFALSNGETHRATGFGCAERAVRGGGE